MGALTLRGITKRYGTVVACDAVDLDVERGEIHGLLGENGAGKSTLMRILLGLETRDAGTILRDGRPVTAGSPREAVALGIGMVHQHFSLVEPLTVWENVILGDTGRIRRSRACAEIHEMSQRYGLPVDPLATVASLSAGERQRVELIKCLRRDPAVLILDEPTSVLTRAESAELFAVLRRVVRSEGRAVVLISHKLAEITAATDRVTVLRHGRVVFRSATAATDVAELARQMVGREVADAAALGLIPAAPHVPEKAQGDPALRIRGLTAPGLTGIDLEVRPGEIAGLYGAEGNGQAQIGDVLCGLVTPDAGTVEVGGVPVDLRTPGALHTAGLGIVPEDRHRAAVVPAMSVAANLTMKDLGTRVWLDRRRLRRRARELAAEFGVVATSLDAPLSSLSGGNQQRVVLARELSGDPRVLVLAQPTQGLDVGAAEDLHERLRRCAHDGMAVLLISTEIEEVLGLADRVLVIASGRVAGELHAAEATPEQLGMLVGGGAG
ncbi:ABC transporter ATP-binding protein [Actinoplanes couchii]|uniref:ABC transporter n=1 Tax=Actinoplanes couchii TaxID=403638 RepID=A0ABQ3XEU2_9ACTN|nr:ABC transporter ATP-binding protein [Actinoplanes couchii]MDR6319884.1 simple sugar transport system ATP-binding protein [Actinoplanes couchii]GID57019.1 ABC transporter [Actinoplanes couchii]